MTRPGPALTSCSRPRSFAESRRLAVAALATLALATTGLATAAVATTGLVATALALVGSAAAAQAPPTPAELENAVAAYRAHLESNPGDAKARSNLGAILAALGRYAEAIEEYKKALAIAPTDPVVRTNLALAHYKSADIPRAADLLDALHRDQPDDRRTTLLLADCRLRLGEYDAVIGLLRPVEAADPDDKAVLYMMGMALIRSGKAEEGRVEVERLMQGGDTAEAHYRLGAASFMGGEYPRALQDFSEALALEPRLPSLRSYYGQALLFTGDPRGAERELREALAQDPNDYEANYYLASILATRKQPDEARPLAEHALQLRPASDDARKLIADLEQPGATAPADASPLLGQAAPDVELRRPEGGTFRLSSLRGQPVLLAFGSYTCPQFRHGAAVLNELHRRFGDRVRFVAVYTREAHPQGESWQSTVNEREGIALPEARTEKERAAHAALARKKLDIPYEVTVDGMDGVLEAAFAAFPSHAFLVDATGKVVYTTALDEASLQPDALQKALEAALR
jgi:tetratricopeptide (TPR) repeat protein